MNRLQAELQRLFLAAGTQDLAGAQGEVRAPVLEVAGPNGWSELAKAWQGVQADLGLPAPAIAVTGTDGYQLWFSLVQPVQTPQALAFLEGVRARYLAALPPERVRLQQAAALPPREVAPERWSAFIAQDLAPLFAEEPWLDHPPGAEAQAELLSRTESAKPEAFLRALSQLATASPAAQRAEAPPPSHAAAGTSDPRRFLLAVMQDPGVDLHLRIKAAKALLPYAKDEPRA